MDVFCGIDWAEDHHDIALADRDGKLLARRRISDDAAGLALLLGLLTEHGDSADDPVPVAIETPRGLLTACLRATGRKVYPINPMAVARYRDRHSAAGRKSDHGDAIVLANILRTDRHVHLPECWLLAQWPPEADEPTDYWLSNLPASTPIEELVRLAKIRWRIEHDYRELKHGLGLGHFEGRSYLGWHRHVTLAALAQAFCTKIRQDPKVPAPG